MLSKAEAFVCSNPSLANKVKLRRSEDLRSFTWLGKRYGNITFEDDSLDFDISEIESVYEDEESN